MFKKIYFKIELLRAYLNKNILFILLGIVFGSLVAYFRPSITKIINQNRIQSQVIGVGGFYTINQLPTSITKLISFGLISTLENGKPAVSPTTAEWSIDGSSTQYTFKLKNISWHDGKKLSPNDINYNFTGSEIKIIDNSTFVITTEKPFSPLLSLLDKPLLKKDLTGLGPYRVNKISYQDSYVKTLYLKSLDKNTPDKDFHFYPNEKELISAYKMGKIDIISEIENPLDLQNWPKTEIIPSLDYQRYLALFFNTEKISDKKTRQALAYAAPKPVNKKDRCLGPISPNSWAYNNTVKEYVQNSSRAKELYNSELLTSINISLKDRRLLPLAEEIKTAWSTILGLKVTISIENQIDTNTYDVILAYGGIPTDPDQYLFWHSTQSTNLTKINNSRLDKLLEEGRLTFDILERKKIYLDFQKFLLEESPAIFLSYPTVYSISRVK